MFEDLRNAFREALDNFKTELNRDALPDTMDRLMRGMVQEVTDAKARLKSVEADHAVAVQRVAHEEEQVATNRRRAAMAAEIGDEETARIASEFVTKHEQRLAVFQQKVAALRQEETLLRAEVQEMMAKIQEAKASRASLQADAGRTQAREAIGESSDLFEAMDRMEAKIRGDEEDYDAMREVDQALGNEYDELKVDPDAPPATSEIDFDAALQELKRRMGKSD